MGIDAVIFDWGGTLTPWAMIDYQQEWLSVARVAAPDDPEPVARALFAAADEIWAMARDEHRSGTFEDICERAGVTAGTEHAEAYRRFWAPSTITDADVGPLFERLRSQGIRVGVLSNTVWPRAWHEEIFERDGVRHLIDGDVYTCELPWTKPHPEAFSAAMGAVGATDPGRCVFVGDRLFDDIWGAGSYGMRTIHVPHSAIPAAQVGHTEGEPDAVVQRLAEVAEVVEAWRAAEAGPHRA